MQLGRIERRNRVERLTKKDDFFDYVLPEQNIFGDNQAFEISLGETEYSCKKYVVGEAIKEFGELEDVLEKYGIDNLDEFIKEYSSRNIKLANDNYALEQELAELKQNAIVPKFKIGQTLYMIPTQSNGLSKIKDYILLSVSLSDIGIRYDLSLKEKEKGIEPFYCASEDMFEKSIFATREEAEQKLANKKENKNDK